MPRRIALIALRMLQGLAPGGEYGGAAIYVAEHAPQNRRGFFTSWVNTTPTLALLLSLIVIMFTQICVNAGYRRPIVQPDGTTITRVQGLGLAHSVPAVRHPAADLALHPAADAGEPGIPADEGGGRGLEGAAARGVRPVAQHQDRAHRAVRPRRRPGRRLVHGAVLRPVLPPEHSEGRPVHRQRAGRVGAVIGVGFVVSSPACRTASAASRSSSAAACSRR